MNVHKWHFEDAGEKDSEGRYDYYYAGFYYLFTENDEEFKARSYQDSPMKASFIGLTRGGMLILNWNNEIPYDNALFCQAVQYLTEHEGIKEIHFLVTGGYIPVDLTLCLKKRLIPVHLRQAKATRSGCK